MVRLSVEVRRHERKEHMTGGITGGKNSKVGQKCVVVFGVVHAWVGQILLNCNVFKRFFVPLTRELRDAMTLDTVTADLS